MILELKVKNFLSFRDEVTLSFEATDDKSFEDLQVVEVAKGVRILRLLAVFGPNASGKTNLLKSFEFLRGFWLQTPKNKNSPTGVIPFLFNEKTPTEPSEFSLTFYIGSTKHLYLLVLDSHKVISEKLYKYSDVNPVAVFERKLNGNISEIVFNKAINISEQAKKELHVKCLLNMSVLAAYNMVNVEVPEIEAVIKWINEKFLRPNFSREKRLDKIMGAIAENGQLKQYVLNFLKRSDFNISGISAKKIEQKLPDELLPLLLNNPILLTSSEIGRIMKDKTLRGVQSEFEHEVEDAQGRTKRFKIAPYFQSDGTRQMMGLAGVMYPLVNLDGFLAIDEIDSSLHPRLVEFVLEDFLEHSGQSQLLMTTHYDGLLEKDSVLRKDGIWFTEKQKSGSSDLYSLVEFQNLDSLKSRQKAYRCGRFGAIPDV